MKHIEMLEEIKRHLGNIEDAYVSNFSITYGYDDGIEEIRATLHNNNCKIEITIDNFEHIFFR